MAGGLAWSGPLPEAGRVAVIGGGVAGLCCAQALLEAQAGVRCTLFDTGENGAGGRMATRRGGVPGDRSLNGFNHPEPWRPHDGLVFDHACQFFTARAPRFQRAVEDWRAHGLVSEWLGTVGSLDAEGRWAPWGGEAPPTKWVGKHGGMRGVAEGLLERLEAQYAPNFEAQRPCWVNRVKGRKDGWELFAKGRSVGTFDFLVIAHNGKCANRLVKPTGAAKTFRQLRSLKLSAIWALMVELEGVDLLPEGFEGAFLEDDATLSWVGNNTAKYGLGARDGRCCWTLFSTAAYGRRNKVPQEAVPEDVARRVKDEMLAAFYALPGVRGPAREPAAWRAQLWGAALPLNTLGEPCTMEWEKRLGVCGDWLLGSGVQDAALSGFAMAERILDRNALENAGLDRKLRPLKSGATAIGSFP